MKKRMLLAIVTFLGVIAFALPAQSSILTFDYIYSLTGSIYRPMDNPPSSYQVPSSSPWLKATFKDDYANKRVILTLSTTGLSGTEQVESWNFNFNPDKPLSMLNFQFDGVNSSGPSPQITRGENLQTGGVSGKFDILFTFLDPTNLFSRGKTSILWITSNNSNVPVRASDFNFRSTLFENYSGGYLSEAHFKGIPNQIVGPGGALLENDDWVIPISDLQWEMSRLHAIELNLVAINKRIIQLNEFKTLPKGATNSLKAMADQLQGLQAKLEEIVAVLPPPSRDFPYIGQDEAVFILDSIRLRSKNVYDIVENIAKPWGVEPSPFLPLFHNILSTGIIEGINIHLLPVLDPILPPLLPPFPQFQ